MSFKDKLNSVKKRNAKKAPKIVADELSKLDTDNQVSDLDITAEHKVAKTKKSLFSKKQKTKTAKSPKKSKSKRKSLFNKRSRRNQSNNKLKLSIAGLAFVLIALLGLAAYLITDNSSQPTIVNNTNIQPNTQDEVKKTIAETNEAISTEDNVNETGQAENTENTDVTMLSDTIDEPLPDDRNVAAEELDALQDERERLSVQEKKLASQVEDNEKLTQLKEELIALKEKEIAALEAKLKQERSEDFSIEAVEETSQ